MHRKQHDVTALFKYLPFVTKDLICKPPPFLPIFIHLYFLFYFGLFLLNILLIFSYSKRVGVLLLGVPSVVILAHFIPRMSSCGPKNEQTSLCGMWLVLCDVVMLCFIVRVTLCSYCSRLVSCLVSRLYGERGGGGSKFNRLL